MALAFPGLGTALNVATVLVGGSAGMLVGHRLQERTREIVTDCLGLVTLLMALQSAWVVSDRSLAAAVGPGAPMLVVLGSLLIGAVIGDRLQIEGRLESLAGTVQRAVQRRLGGQDGADAERERFIEGWMTASLLFCVGPLTVLGSINDGLGRGIDQLALKSVLDGFAALAFASTFGVGVLASAASVAVVQGAFTLVGVLLGSVLPDAQVAALTATGGLLLVGISLRLLRVRDIPVGDLLPALLVAPLLTTLVDALR